MYPRYLIILLASFLLLSSSILFAQPPDTLWTRTYDAGECHHVRQTSDGGFIIAGSVHDGPTDHEYIYLIKTDPSGNELWNHMYGNSRGGSTQREVGYCVQQTTDGGYIVTGATHSWDGEWDQIWLVKTDRDGNAEWTQTYYDQYFDGLDCGNWVEQTDDGGYLVTGHSFSTDVRLFKTDSGGEMIWSTTFGGEFQDIGNCGMPTPDGGIIVAGTDQTADMGREILLVKTDEWGNEVWTRRFGTEHGDYGNEVQLTSDGGFILIGSSTPGIGDPPSARLIKTDADGNEQWNRLYSTIYSGTGISVQETADGGFIFAGSMSESLQDDSDLWIVRTDADGNELWRHTFGGPDYDTGASIHVTADGGYVVAGLTQEGEGGPWLVRLAPDWDAPLATITLTPLNTPIQIPAAGGSFTFDVFTTNSLTTGTLGQVWSVVELPNGNEYFGPEMYRTRLMFEPGMTHAMIDIQQIVPAYAPAGTYIYKGRVGFYPQDIYAQDSFEFEKLDE